MAKPFTLEQIEQLRSNPYTYKVTSSKIFFTATEPVAEGEFVKVRITEAMDFELIGETVE